MISILVYSGLTLLILGELLLPGYFLALDTVWGKAFPDIFTKTIYGVDGVGKEFSDYPVPLAILLFYAFLQLDNIIPLWLLQKLLLFIILLLSGISMHRIVPVKNDFARYFAGFLYMVNPFIYIRFLAGHFYLLWSYAVLPLVINSFIDITKEPNRRNIFKVVLFLTMVTPQVQFLPMSFGTFILLLFIGAKKENLASRLRDLMLVVSGFVMLNLSWIASIAKGTGSVTEAIKQITPQHLLVFTSRPAFDFNVLFNIAAMYGFWRGGYDLPKDSIPIWYFFFFIILFLTVHGFFKERNRNRKIAYSFGLVAVVALVLATGVTHKYFSKLFLLLYNYVPFFAGFREPQKFVALLTFVYAYFGAIAVDEFAENSKKRRGYYALLCIVIVTPFIYTHNMLFAFDGQLKSVDYPPDWYDVDAFLNKDEDDFIVLFLPWHGYMDFTWLRNNDKRIANPAGIFFGKPVIQGDTIEAGGVYSQSTYPVSKYIEFLLTNKDKIDNFGELLAPLNVKYVILAKEADYRIYGFLFKQNDLKLIEETENLYIFKNKNIVGKIYATNGISYIKNWDELLKRSKEEDITSKVYLLGGGLGNGESDKEMLGYKRQNLARYELRKKPTKRYIIFAAPYSDKWRLNEEKPIKNLGITNAYEVKGDSLAIEYKGYKGYLVGYIISIVFFIYLLKETLINRGDIIKTR